MRVSTGTSVGPYEVVGWLGAGGMGEVYRAHDARLKRDVAVKLIPEASVANANRLHRFEQEARAAGQLNHPNLLTVYDIGTHNGAPYIVSELLEGESLRGLLQRGALPLHKALSYARQTAEGLAAAHDKGIVHRDLKPDNLFITNDGHLKILDFGIAKLTQPGTSVSGAVNLGTETAEGTILGTAGYMSPEQVRGQPVDPRSDIFSLGVILSEMLTGRAVFTRANTADTLAAILKEDAPPPAVPIPVPLERIIGRCLEKSRERRFQSTRDLAFALESLAGGIVEGAPAPPASQRPRRALTWALAGAVMATALVLALPTRTGELPSVAPITMTGALASNVSIANTVTVAFGNTMTISPQGDVAAFLGETIGGASGRQLHVRKLDEQHATPLPGSDNASAPFFSPGGDWIGFFAHGKLKRVAVTGGVPQDLADAPEPRGGAWGPDDLIVFSPDKTAGTRLLRVPASAGRAEPLGSLAEGEVIQAWPQLLPHGRGVLYTGSSVPGQYNESNLMVQPLDGGSPKVVHRGGYHGRYVPSGLRSAQRTDRLGHLVYIRDGILWAAAFDLDRLKVTGPHVNALAGVASNSITGGAQFSASSNGTLLFRPGQATSEGVRLQWMDQQGTLAPLLTRTANVLNPAFARDGRLAMEIREGPPNIWLSNPAGRLVQLTFDPVRAIQPAFTGDGERLAFASARGDKSTLNLWWQRVDGKGGTQRLTESRNSQLPGSWQPDGRLLAFEEQSPATSHDLMILTMEGDEASGWTPGTTRAFLNTTASEREPTFSPDGKWLAYYSDRSGTGQVYVRPFPGPGTEVSISSGGGRNPTWSRTRREIFYGGANGQIMVVRYAVRGQAFVPGEPRLWSEGRYQVRGPNRMFDLHPDGLRFALAPAAPLADNLVTFKINFFDDLRRIAPATGR